MADSLNQRPEFDLCMDLDECGAWHSPVFDNVELGCDEYDLSSV